MNEMVKSIEATNWEQARMNIVTVSSRYQITIPKEIRERFKIEPGNKALFISRGKTIEIVFPRSDKELEEMKRVYSKTSEFFKNSEV